MAARVGGEAENISLVVKFDELNRNGRVLQDPVEKSFLSFVVNTGVNRRRWEHAELECQRLGIELTKASQEISSLEHKLSVARNMLDNEQSQRRKAEVERDRLDSQLRLLRQLVLDDQLVDEVKLSKIRTIGVSDYRTDDGLYSPNVHTPKGILKKINQTEDSIVDVDDFSFDDTRDLCDSRSRLGRRSNSRKRSRSAGRDFAGDNILENIASPRTDFQIKKRNRRSKSVVAFDNVASDETSLEDTDTRPRSYSAHERNIIESDTRTSNNFSTASTGHVFVQKAFIKAEKCGVCDKRFKFGKISNKCSLCRLVLHTECSDRAPLTCSGRGSPEVCRTPLADRTKSPGGRKPYFASPMLR